MAYLRTNGELDGLDGDKVTIDCSFTRRNGRLLVENNAGSVTLIYLSPIQMRALAALLLITVEEIERES